MEQLKNAKDAVDFIHGTLKFGSKLGLHNITELLSRLGDPQDNLKFIHIAGTNGKGSVAAMTASVLTEAGYRVGMFTSPYIYRFHERIQIGGEEISDEALLSCTQRVKSAIDTMVAEGFTHPTEFEVVTAVGMLHFFHEKCDIVVLEVGMGGRLDATNVIKTPLSCAITSIHYDHMEYLGDTLTQIAGEKCGILKEGVPVVVYPDEPEEALSAIKKHANEKHAPLILPKEAHLLSSSIHGSTFSYGDVTYSLSLLGAHQVKNASMVLALLDVVRSAGFEVSEKAVQKGLSTVSWPGRWQVLGESPLFIMDGAHNENGMASFLDAVNTLLPNQKKIFISGMLRDKEYKKCLALLGGEWEKLYAVTVPNPRTLSSKEYAKEAEKYGKNVIPSTPEEAVKAALKEADENTAILAFGSLYLLGDIRAAYEKYTERSNA